jgi:hypothetical protein
MYQDMLARNGVLVALLLVVAAIVGAFLISLFWPVMTRPAPIVEALKWAMVTLSGLLGSRTIAAGLGKKSQVKGARRDAKGRFCGNSDQLVEGEQGWDPA